MLTGCPGNRHRPAFLGPNQRSRHTGRGDISRQSRPIAARPILKKSIRDLAVFGGLPLFNTPRPTGQFNTPDADAYVDQLRQIYERRWLTNGGYCVVKLEATLAEYHKCRHCIAVANAATGLMMLLQAVAGGEAGEIIMPALAYRGLPHFARWAGHAPRFVDVDADTHTMDPEEVRKALSDRTRCILAVPSFTSLGHIDKLCEIAAEAAMPIVFDSVDALACTHKGRPTGSFGVAEVFSLHASKLINAFEGGYITTNDDALAADLRRQRDFNHPGLAPEAQVAPVHLVGLNAKLNELHAALAILSFEGIEQRVAENRRRYETWLTIVTNIPGLSVLAHHGSTTEKRNYRAVVIRLNAEWQLSRTQTLMILAAEGAAARPYFHPPLHCLAPWKAELPFHPLPVTEAIAGSHCQMPVGEMTSQEDILRIGEVLRTLAADGAAIAKRLGAA